MVFSRITCDNAIGTHFTETSFFEYISRRFTVIPLNVEKAPYNGFEWKYYHCTHENLPPKIYTSPAYGIRTGELNRIEGGYLLVVDFDNKSGHEQFFIEHEHLRNVFENTVIIKTTFGYHYFFLTTRPIKTRKIKIYGGIDIKAKGAYVVGAGSKRNVWIDENGLKSKKGKGTLVGTDIYKLASDPDNLSITHLTDDVLTDIYTAFGKEDNDIVIYNNNSAKYSLNSPNHTVNTVPKNTVSKLNDRYSGKSKLNNVVIDDIILDIGKNFPNAVEYLYCKDFKSDILENRSKLDFIIIRYLRSKEYSAQDIYDFFKLIANQNIKAYKRMMIEKNTSYIDYTIIKADKVLKELAEIQDGNRLVFQEIFDSLVKCDISLFFQSDKPNMQIKLFDSLLFIVNRTIELGFSSKMTISGKRLANALGFNEDTAYNRFQRLIDYGYITCDVKGKYITHMASQYTVNYDVILDVIECAIETEALSDYNSDTLNKELRSKIAKEADRLKLYRN